MSFAEIHKEYRHAVGPVEGYCPAPSGLLLESDLHIDELFDRALEPVGRGTLRVGAHPGFGGNTPPATPTNQIPDYSAFEAVFEQLRKKQPGQNRIISDEDFKTFQSLPGNDKSNC